MLNERSQINVSWSKLYCTYKTLSCRWLSVSWASWLDQQLQRGGKQFFASVSLTESVVYLSALQVNFTTRSVRALQAFNTFFQDVLYFIAHPCFLLDHTADLQKVANGANAIRGICVTGRKFANWNTKKEIFVYFRRFQDTFGISWVFPQILQHKGEILYDFNNKNAFLLPKISICGDFDTFCRSAT